MNAIGQIIERAKKLDKNKTIVFNESSDKRVLEAVEHISLNNIADVVLIGDRNKIESVDGSRNLSRVRFIDPDNFEGYEQYVAELVELRKHKGITEDKARTILKDYLYFGCMMLRMGDADGMVTGASTKTDDVFRAAFQVVGTAEGVNYVNGSYILCLPKPTYGENGVLVCADCAVIPDPTSEQLADIAIMSACTAKNILGIEPRVAMLSFSTKSSSRHAMVDKVAEAVKIAKRKSPDLIIDGEMQVDAAFVKEVARIKCPDSPVAGRANVLIFPDLDAANIGYKLVHRLAEADVIGLITQGLKRPVNDLSRGCSVKNIIDLTAATVLQVNAGK